MEEAEKLVPFEEEVGTYKGSKYDIRSAIEKLREVVRRVKSNNQEEPEESGDRIPDNSVEALLKDVLRPDTVETGKVEEAVDLLETAEKLHEGEKILHLKEARKTIVKASNGTTMTESEKNKLDMRGAFTMI